MVGRIIKGIGGFYYVRTSGGVCECRARGLFRNDKITPLIGDYVTFEPEDLTEQTGSIRSILPRKNEIVRPRAANADQILLVFSSAVPKPSYTVLNRYLAVTSQNEIPVMLVVTKNDLAGEKERDEIRKAFHGTGYQVFYTSSFTGEGVNELREALTSKTSVFAGPSGVGKSSLINALLEEERMEVGALSRKIERGKNTTRHAELLSLDANSFILDTPGFTSVDFDHLDKEMLAYEFQEFIPYLTECRFSTCTHRKEDGCAVRQAVTDGLLSAVRYQSYVEMYDRLNGLRRY